MDTSNKNTSNQKKASIAAKESGAAETPKKLRAGACITATEEIKNCLKNSDSKLGAVIEKYGAIEYTLSTDYLTALLSNIVGQQLSGRVADVIWGRVAALVDGEITAKSVLALDNDCLRRAGLSRNKAEYIKNIARAVEDGFLTLDKFNEMTNDAIVTQLTAIKGIGEWTAEMFLIFSLGRLDVFSKGDGGLKRAIFNLYNKGEPMSKPDQIAITEKWKPYRSIASLYLWKSLDNR